VRSLKIASINEAVSSPENTYEIRNTGYWKKNHIALLVNRSPDVGFQTALLICILTY
jgi:hypothetical protein